MKSAIGPDRRQSLSRYSLKRLTSQDEARHHCETVFRGFRDFRFIDPAAATYLHSASVGAGTFRLVSVHSCGHEIALRETQTCGILVPLRGNIKVQGDNQELEAGPGEGIIAMPGQRTTRLGPGYVGIAAFVDEPASRFDRQLTRPSPQLRSFIGYCVDACDTSNYLAANHSTLSSMAGLLGELVAQSLAGPDSGAQETRTTGTLERHVVAAEAWIEAHSREICSVSELAAAVGLNLRSLQVAFRRHRGYSPRQAIERMRLERVRNDLLAGPEGRSVTSVAMENGVLHLGRFAANYRQLFGESPSDTLKRSRN